MKDKRTLYEMLGVRPHATATEVRTAYRLALEALEAQRGALGAHEFDEQFQLLRVAYSTLSDSISRAGYDADLEAAAKAESALAATGALSTSVTTASGARADALGLRADALSLRADALMARAEIEAASSRQGFGLWGDLSPSARRLLVFVTLLLVAGLMTTGISRCSMRSAQEQMVMREAREKKAAEQVALQEYYQTYGVRPANMAELELMEAERRRKENAERQTAIDNRRAEEEQKRWEEESQRRGEEVSRNVQRAMESAREEQQRLKFEAEQLALEINYATSDLERRRLELKLRQLKERMKQE